MTINLKRLKAERIASGMTQDEVAQSMGWKHERHMQKERMGLFQLELMSLQKLL
ncbi:Cro-like protein [Streptococcus dysgalactiae subsp. equisimilis]|uniref:Cro-like protein n=1 Tax=Streptococcus dysgalactiae subsp. equisimilis TaxID=119602 RepID=A0AAE9U1R6_STREQ|nr:Cro-like protein [Streptococcus dysgalactiae subsp. equisimilis]